MRVHLQPCSLALRGSIASVALVNTAHMLHQPLPQLTESRQQGLSSFTFGCPVDPEVYMMVQMSVRVASAGGAM